MNVTEIISVAQKHPGVPLAIITDCAEPSDMVLVRQLQAAGARFHLFEPGNFTPADAEQYPLCVNFDCVL